MAEAWRRGGIFVAGLLAGTLLAGGVLYWWLGSDRASPRPPSSAVGMTQPGPGTASQSTAAPAAPLAQPVSCTFSPMVAQGGPGDGMFRLQDGVQAAAQPSAYLAVAREAQQAGRARDAEVALITACRVAGHLSGAGSVEVAEAQQRLAQHYAALARAAGAAPPKELLRRAERLLADSVRAYAAALGKNHARTRQAAQALDAVKRGDLEQAVQAAGLSTLGAAQASANAASTGDDVAAAGSASTPGGECAQAQSAAQRLVCSDAELAQLDRDLWRLHAQARGVTADPGGFERRNEQAWARRESGCRDKACLQQWYAKRRIELLAEFGGARR